MSGFVPHQPKGIDRLLVDPALEPGRLRMHVSEIEPGTRSHPPHTHEGVEAFYVLEGEGVLEIGEERYPLRANQGIVLDPGTLHGLFNNGTGKMRYLVIISK
jgi:(S)-ureidoglycine aminohydrolase